MKKDVSTYARQRLCKNHQRCIFRIETKIAMKLQSEIFFELIQARILNVCHSKILKNHWSKTFSYHSLRANVNNEAVMSVIHSKQWLSSRSVRLDRYEQHIALFELWGLPRVICYLTFDLTAAPCWLQISMNVQVCACGCVCKWGRTDVKVGIGQTFWSQLLHALWLPVTSESLISKSRPLW